jgi:uncharacterized spore protein YtfJ
MMMTVVGSDATEDATDEARKAAEHGGVTDRLIERIVGRFGGHTGVQALFGEPIERGGSTVVPVGRLRWLAGAGSGSAPIPGGDRSGDGSGGGGLAVADPVGYIEIGPSGVRFRPIVGLPPNPLAILAIGLSIALVLRAVARLLKR